MLKRTIHKLLRQALIFSRALRISLLYSFFGVVSQCKHQPTCGTYALEVLKSDGLISGGKKAIIRLLNCR